MVRFGRRTALSAVLALSLISLGGAVQIAGASPTPAPVTLGFSTPYGCTYAIGANPTGAVYGVDDCTGDIFSVGNGGTGPLSVLANDSDDPIGVSYHDGLLYVINDDGSIDTVSAGGGSLSVLVAAPSVTGGEAGGQNETWDSSGNAYIANYSNDVIGEVASGMTTETTAGIAIPGGCGPWDVTTRGSSLYIACWDSGQILQASLPVPLGGETPSVVSAPPVVEAGGIAQDAAGNIYVGGDLEGNVVVVPADQSAAYLLPTTGASFGDPWSLAFADGSLVVSDYFTGELFLVGVVNAPPAVTSLHVNESATTVNATWTANGASSYECTLMYGYQDPTSFTQTTTGPSCAFNTSPTNAPYGVSVVAYNGAANSPSVVSFATLPTPPTTTTTAPHKAPVKHTIVCVKGKKVRRITGVNPRCPAGYKKR